MSDVGENIDSLLQSLPTIIIPKIGNSSFRFSPECDSNDQISEISSVSNGYGNLFPVVKTHLGISSRKKLNPNYYIETQEFVDFGKFSTYLLEFENAGIKERYHHYLLRENARGCIPWIVSLPCVLYYIPCMAFLYNDVVVFHSDIYYSYGLIILCGISLILLFWYSWMLRTWSAFHDLLYHVDGDISESSMDLHIHEYKSRAHKLLILGTMVSSMFTLATGFLVINRIYSGRCYLGCIEQFPLSSTCFLLYSPLHFSILMFTTWRVTAILQTISSVCLLSGYIMFHANANTYSLSFLDIYSHLQIICLWFFWVLTMYIIQRMRISAFRQQEYLVRMISNKKQPVDDIENLDIDEANILL